VALLQLCAAGALPKQSQFWFSTKSMDTTVYYDDFRGCHQSECVYVAPAALSNDDTLLAPYSSQKLWAVATDSQNGEYSISWVFSQNRPTEVSTTLWISPVAGHNIPPSVFDPTPYLARADPDPIVAKFVASISQARIKSTVERLASRFFTRNSVSAEAVEAAHFLEDYMNEAGCTETRLHQFRQGYSPNVICELPGYDLEAPAVVVGAHYDCRATGLTDPTQRAPGADDNGSGTAGLLDILITAVELMSEGVSFRRKLIFALFSGEEQGLIGSGVYAAQLSTDDVELEGMVGLDMIGYPQPNAPTTLYWMSRSTNQNLTNLGIALTKTYLGENTIVAPTSACCSDQQSFHSRGYAAAAVAESLAYTNNPNYHRSSDLPETLSFSHVWRTTQGAAALIATIAEPRGAQKS